MSRTKRIIAAAIPVLWLAPMADAEGTWTIGTFALGQTGYYVGQDDEVALLPFVSFETGRFEFSLHDGVAYHAIQATGPNDEKTQLSFVLSPRWEPDFGSDPMFDGLNRDTALEAGVEGRYEAGLFFAEGDARFDISETHDGYTASAFAGLQYEAGAFSIEGGIGARYRSDKLNQHLFGVAASEATSRRAAFSADSTTTAFASVTAAYVLNDNLAVVGELAFEDLGKMERSPLVDEGSTSSLALGLIYQF